MARSCDNVYCRSMPWRELVEAYLGDLADQGRRSHTLRGYRCDLAELVDHLEGHGAITDAAVVDAAGLRGFLASLERLAPATQARKRSAVRGFLRWAAARGLVDASLLDLLAAPSPVTRAVGVVSERSAVEAVLAVIPRQADRDQLMFGLLARLGMRPGEVLGLGVGDFDEAGGTLELAGWGGVRRRVLVDDPQILMRLVNWKRTLGRQDGPLFCAPGRTTPLRYQSMAGRWARYEAAAGVTVRLSDLRRAHAADLLAGGVPEWAVRNRLGQQNGPLTGPTLAGQSADDAVRAWRAASSAPAAKEHQAPGSSRSAG